MSDTSVYFLFSKWVLHWEVRVLFMLGFGIQLFQWALRNNLEVLLLVSSVFIFVIILVIAANIEWESYSVSLYCNFRMKK